MDDMMQQYNDMIITALDNQIPEKTKLVRDTHHQPWFDDKIKKKKSFNNIREKGIGCKISQDTHGGLSTINVYMSLTSSRQHNKITSKGRLKKTKMITKLFLTLPIAYCLGNKTHPYQIQPPHQH